MQESTAQQSAYEPFVRLEQRFGASPRWDVRAAYHWEVSQAFLLRLNYYW